LAQLDSVIAKQTFELSEKLAQVIASGHPQNVQMGLGSP